MIFPQFSLRQQRIQHVFEGPLHLLGVRTLVVVQRLKGSVFCLHEIIRAAQSRRVALIEHRSCVQQFVYQSFLDRGLFSETFFQQFNRYLVIWRNVTKVGRPTEKRTFCCPRGRRISGENLPPHEFALRAEQRLETARRCFRKLEKN